MLDLCSIVGDRGKDGAKSLNAHGDVKQMTGEEEVVVVSEDRHY